MTAVAETRVRRTRVSFRQAVKDTLVITRRNLLRNIRLPQLLIFATVQPVMFLLLFNYVFGGAIGTAIPAAAAGKYINWLVPGLIIQVAMFGSGQTALGLTEDLSKGVIDRFRSLPMARSAVLAGRTLSDLVRNGFVIGLMLAIGLLIGFRWQTTVFGVMAGLLVAMIFAFALSWVMAAVGLAVKNPEAAQSAVFLPVFPLVFASSVFVPTGTMPGWLQAFADNQPVTITTNALRGLMLGGGALPEGATVAGEVFLSLAWAFGILVLAAPLAIWVYRRTVS
jgi:ABC transporter DrrB family efflux protein